MELLLRKIPTENKSAWRSLYLELGKESYQKLLYYFSQNYPAGGKISVREWLHSKGITERYLTRRLEDRFGGRHVGQDIHPMSLLQMLIVLEGLSPRLRKLIQEELQSQLEVRGFFGMDFIHLDEISIGKGTIVDPELHLRVFPGLELHSEPIKKRLQAYQAIARLEYQYFQCLFPSNLKEPLIENHAIKRTYTLYEVLNNKQEDEQWRRCLQSIIREMYLRKIASVLSREELERLREEDDHSLYLRNLISQTLNEDGLNIDFLRSSLKLHYG